jgi:hypothetical protein
MNNAKKLKRLKDKLQKIKILLFIALILSAYYVSFHQTKKNTKYYLKLKAHAKRAYAFEIPHPLLVSRWPEHIPFAKAWKKIMGSKASRFWLIADTIDPAVNLNYFVYPKELLMSMETQNLLDMRMLARMKGPIRRVEPKNYEKIVVIEGYSAEVINKWDGSQ